MQARKIHWKHAKTLYANCQINKAMLWLPDSRHAFMSESDETSFASGVSLMLEMVESIGLMTRALCDCHDRHEQGGSDAQTRRYWRGGSNAQTRRNWQAQCLQTNAAAYRAKAENLEIFAASIPPPHNDGKPVQVD